MNNNEAPEVGTVVTVRPAGRRRSFLLHVDQLERIGDDVLMIGRLPSVKYPGDFRGYGSAWVSEIVPVTIKGA